MAIRRTEGGRWRGRLGVAAAAGSAAVLLALAALWGRSYWVMETIDLSLARSAPGTAPGTGVWVWDQAVLGSGGGLVALYWMRDAASGVSGGGNSQAMRRLVKPFVRTRQPDAKFLARRGEPVGPWRSLRWKWTRPACPSRPAGPLLRSTCDLLVPYWVLMLPWALTPIWWAWCPPGRAWPRLTTRLLMAATAATAVALGGLSAFWRVTAEDRARDAVEGLNGYCCEEPPGPGPKVVTGVWLIDIAVTDEDLAALRPALAALPNLRNLEIHSGAVTDAGLANLEGLVRLREVKLFDNPGLTDAGLAHLGGLLNLEELWLFDNPGITGTGLAYLGDMTRLRRLDLRQTHVTDAGLARLPPLPQLETLWLQDTGVGDAGLAHLAGLPALRSLDFSRLHPAIRRPGHSFLPKITDAGLVHLGRLTGLESLDLGGTGITDAGLAHLGRLTSLEFLGLNGTGITDAGLFHLERLPRLQHVRLTGTRVTDAGMARLRRSLPGDAAVYKE